MANYSTIFRSLRVNLLQRIRPAITNMLKYLKSRAQYTGDSEMARKWWLLISALDPGGCGGKFKKKDRLAACG